MNRNSRLGVQKAISDAMYVPHTPTRYSSPSNARWWKSAQVAAQKSPDAPQNFCACLNQYRELEDRKKRKKSSKRWTQPGNAVSKSYEDGEEHSEYVEGGTDRVEESVALLARIEVDSLFIILTAVVLLLLLRHCAHRLPANRLRRRRPPLNRAWLLLFRRRRLLGHFGAFHIHPFVDIIGHRNSKIKLLVE